MKDRHHGKSRRQNPGCSRCALWRLSLLQLATTYLSFVSHGPLKLPVGMRHTHVLGGTYAGVADRLSRIQKHVYGRRYRALVI